MLKPVKGQSFRALTVRGYLLLPFGIGGRANKVTWNCSPSSGDTTSESLPVSHATVIARPSIRRYSNGRRRAPLVTLQGALLLPFGYLRIGGRANKVMWDCSPSSGDIACKSLPVSHVTVIGRPSIRRYPNGRRRAPLATLRGALLLPFGNLRIDGWATIFTWDCSPSSSDTT